jgi:hypothetical protein
MPVEHQLTCCLPGAALQGALASLAKGSRGATTEERLQHVLSFTFDNLRKEEKEMFLDAVSVLPGQDAEIAQAVWCVQHGDAAVQHLERLQRYGLIFIELAHHRPWAQKAYKSKYVIRVHDVICALGRDIIENSSSPHFATRIWVTDTGKLVNFEVCISAEYTHKHRLPSTLCCSQVSQGVAGSTI